MSSFTLNSASSKREKLISILVTELLLKIQEFGVEHKNTKNTVDVILDASCGVYFMAVQHVLRESSPEARKRIISDTEEIIKKYMDEIYEKYNYDNKEN